MSKPPPLPETGLPTMAPPPDDEEVGDFLPTTPPPSHHPTRPPLWHDIVLFVCLGGGGLSAWDHLLSALTHLANLLP